MLIICLTNVKKAAACEGRGFFLLGLSSRANDKKGTE